MTDFKEIDALFESAFRRLGAGTSSPYNEPPLASDHFLLKRSWDYFRRRAEEMEAEWKQIVAAKEEETRALQELLRQRDERLSELEQNVRESESVEEAFARAQLSEQMGFSDVTKKLHDTWEEERAALLHSVEDANARVQRIRAEAEQRLKSGEKEIASLRASLDSARGELSIQAEKRLGAEAELTRALRDRDDHIRTLESKVDLLRSELERRDATLQQIMEEQEARRRELENLQAAASKSAAELATKNERVRFLEEQLAAARRQIDDMRASWSREQAEWRELWDRSRRLWEEKGGEK
jgi:chromosome segregation ATPase